MLGKVLKEEEANPILFEFLEESFQLLDQGSGHMENFHLQFLWRLSEFLGFHAGQVGEFLDQLREAGVPGMGELFKVIAIQPPDAPTPPGFETDAPDAGQ